MTEMATDITAPKDFDALRSLILERRSTLPKRLMQVAAYALDNPDESAFRTAASIAEASKVQPSTLVRFAQQFGFEGFSSLQLLFRARLRERTSTYEERLRLLKQEGPQLSENANILNGFVAAGHRSLDALSMSIDHDVFEQAVTVLARAETIFLVAKRRAYPISSYMAYALGKLKVKCIAVGTAAGIDDDVLALAGPLDAAFAVSFAPYASETIAQANALSDQGVAVVEHIFGQNFGQQGLAHAGGTEKNE